MQIAEKIREMLTADIRLTPELLHYMESMAGAADTAEISRQMADGDDCETQSLFELIFYPDTHQQVHLEDDLESDALAERQVQAIVRHLAEKPPRTCLVFPNGEKTASFPVPENVLQQYVRRLNLTRRIARRVSETISSVADDRRQELLVRVKLRNTRFRFSGQTVSFLCTYLERLPVATDTDMERMELALSLLDQMPEKVDVYTALMAQKHHCAEMIRQADSSERNLRRQPVEALIMQGVNIPCISVDEARQQMNRIDEIALQVFGKTEAAGPFETQSEAPLNLGALGSAYNLDKVIKILS